MSGTEIVFRASGLIFKSTVMLCNALGHWFYIQNRTVL